MAGGRYAWMVLILAAAATPAVAAQDVPAQDIAALSAADRNAANTGVAEPPLSSMALWAVSMTSARIRCFQPDRDIPVTDWRSAEAVLPNRGHASTIWSIFVHPPDSPNDYVVRETLAGRDWIVVSPASLHAPTLDAARAMLPPGVVELVKSARDSKSLAEVWIGPQ